MTPQPDPGPDLPDIEPSAQFAQCVMQRIAEVEDLRARAAAQDRALRVIWVCAGLAGALGALSVGAALSGPLPGLAAAGEAAVCAFAVSRGEQWLPVALIAAGLGFAGAAAAQTVPRQPYPAEGRT
ncbi:MAG: hypothetical protein FJX74_25870 [Armatimonadetes bacterium]|nr:hypothetical protein [Armatimonadota bacterium]